MAGASTISSDRRADTVQASAVETMAREHLIQPWEGLEHLGRKVRTVVGKAEGIYVYDAKGNRLIDGPGGMWCVQIGYGRREIAEAIAHQAMDLTYNSPWYTTSEPAARLAARIAEMTPGDLNRVFFTTGGSTAVDSVLRFTQFFNNYLGRPDKKIILSRQGAYHGSTYLSASCSGKERDKNHFDFATDLVHHLSSPNPYRRPDGVTVEAFGDGLVSELEQAIAEIGPDRVAAFIAEPILASGGVIVPPHDYHRRTREICRKHDILYIADEVVTAFGRLGHWFASQAEFGIVPDIIIFAKGITSGYVPLGGFAISQAVLDRVSGPDNKGAVFANGYTYSGHPVACAAALANIEVIEKEGLLERVREISPYFLSRLKELEELPIVGEVRGQGLVACIDCVADKQSRNPLRLDYEVGNRIDRHCQALGLIVRPMINMCVMSPPLVIARHQIDRMVDILREGIERTQRDLKAEGVI
jgi:adenosylmethionine-8-amino-7-oxononanoate aminotransferase